MEYWSYTSLTESNSPEITGTILVSWQNQRAFDQWTPWQTIEREFWWKSAVSCDNGPQEWFAPVFFRLSTYFFFPRPQLNHHNSIKFSGTHKVLAPIFSYRGKVIHSFSPWVYMLNLLHKARLALAQVTKLWNSTLFINSRFVLGFFSF